MNKINLQNINFTRYNDKRINDEIGNQLSIIVNEILKYRDKLGIVSIVLLGGFGRGEGSVIFRNGAVRPLNDYDVNIVIKKHFLFFDDLPSLNVSKIIKIICDNIKDKIEVSHVDIGVIPYSKLSTLPNTIANYETKYGGKILWGEDVLKKMPHYNPKEIILSCGITLLFNRFNCLINGFPPANSNRNEHSIIQSVKSLHACCESLLLLSGDYHYSYEERNKRFKTIFPQKFSELYKKIPQLSEYVDKATKFKLYPDYVMFPDYEKLWETTVDMYFEVFKYYMNSYYKINTSNLDIIIKNFLIENKGNIKENILFWGEYILNSWYNGYKIFRFNPNYKPNIYLYASEPYLLYMMRYGKNEKYMEMTKYYLGKVININHKENLFSLRSKSIIILGRGAREP